MPGPCPQYLANSDAPTVEWSRAILGRTGGLSPGRTLGPVVAIDGEVGGVVLGVDGTDELLDGGLLADGDVDLSPPALVQPAAAIGIIRAIAATGRNRTRRVSHASPLAA